MRKATFDPAKRIDIYFRCNRNGSIDFIFQYSNESPYSMIYEDIEFNLYGSEGEKKKILNLTHGNGVSFPAGNRARVTVTDTNTNINEGQYYYELYRPNLGKTWVTGYAYCHNGIYDGVTEDSETVTVNENGEEITITVTNSDFSLLEFNRQTGNYTLVLTDADKMVELNSASAISLTVPPNSSVAFDIGTVILIIQYGIGQASVVAGSGVTIRSAGNALNLSAQYAGASLIKVGTDEWYLNGSIA